MKLISLVSSVIILIVVTVSSSAQTTVANNASSSEGLMQGVNLQRTNAYQTKGVSQIHGLLWKSAKLFEMDYAGVLTESFDVISLNLAHIGFSEPVVTQNLIYFQLCVSLNQNYIVALDRNTGRGIWSFKLREAISAPAIADDSLYIVTSDRDLYSLDANTGAERWKYNSKDQTWNVESAPAVAGGIVYFTSLAGNLYALNATTREVKWFFRSKGMLTSPAFGTDQVYFANEKGTVYAIDIQTGQERWNFKAKRRPGNPIVGNDLIYFRTAEGNLYAIEAKTGQQKWMVQVGGKVEGVLPVMSVTIGTDLALYEGTIFFAGSEKNSDYLFAIDAQTGQQKWKFKVDGPCRSPIAADGMIYLGSYGNLYAIDAKTGAQKWFLRTKTELKGKTVKNVASSPAVVDNTLYFVNDDGFFYAVK